MYDTEPELIQALIARDESAYRHVIREHQPAMLGLAKSIVGAKIADEVVQETWFSVMRSLPRFEGRSSLKTWIMRIVANEAKTRLRKEKRTISLEGLTANDPELATRFTDRGHWMKGGEPTAWDADSPEALLSSAELEACLQLVISALPEMQAATIRLREHEGYALKEICNILDVSESNVRVLLHRARTRVYNAVDHFQNTGECCET